ncbi:hypothetical protein [Candidatus Nitrosotalea okcheonensis]|uniref:Uncharacterized protein n=1 Tax=Candidatus Nitrosotalea okcheonensis TaxID=1903276 RepID=A0A2H1FEW2_9ARCH|nr:hypothetical protein [Candidatus Nitrosotalea okcheonensis]SMH71300.1 protein of unknown function [Candidatus Nitrosotalea okcheonensis]
MMKKYPDEMTLDEFDEMPWIKSKQFGLDRQASIEEIKKYAEKISGQIYTQVDGDQDRMYSKGLRFVNRTGIYEVVRLDGYEADNS